MKKLIPHFTPFDLFLWGFSVLAILISYLAFPEGSGTSAIGSVIGVTALIFVAKGAVLGQFLMLAFCLFYGIHALRFRYYGEMLTYLGMSAPAAVFSIVTWLRHPFRDSAQVAVVSLSRRRVWLSLLSTVAVTVLFYFILKALGTAELLLSTFSRGHQLHCRHPELSAKPLVRGGVRGKRRGAHRPVGSHAFSGYHGASRLHLLCGLPF